MYKEYILILLTPQAEGRDPLFCLFIKIDSFSYSLYILH